ncbi:MAG TPA: hypothetical protein VG838_09950 [Opitutaceae bacterium]|nr:hypothetical protein [Opitutaceae bacterium]
MGHLLLGIFLLLFGLNIVAGLSIPMGLIGTLAIVAGVFLLIERARVGWPKP